MNAPRALPTWSGPVGLADTNSTLTERGRPAGDHSPGGRVGQDRGDRRLEGAVAKPQVEEAGRRDLGRGDRRRPPDRPRPRRRAPPRARRRWRAAPCDTAGRASSRGCWRSRRGPRRRVARPRPRAQRVVRPGGQGAGRDSPIPGASDRRPDIGTECRWSCRLGDRMGVGHGSASMWRAYGSGATAWLVRETASLARELTRRSGIRQFSCHATCKVSVGRPSTFVPCAATSWCRDARSRVRAQVRCGASSVFQWFSGVAISTRHRPYLGLIMRQRNDPSISDGHQRRQPRRGSSHR